MAPAARSHRSLRPTLPRQAGPRLFKWLYAYSGSSSGDENQIQRRCEADSTSPRSSVEVASETQTQQLSSTDSSGYSMEFVVAAMATGNDGGLNSKRKLDIAHSTPMTVLSMDSQAKVRRRGSSMSSNDSTVMKRSLSDGTINARVFSDASDSELDTDAGEQSNTASCPISPSSNTSDSVNEATAQLDAMSPRDTAPVGVIRTSPFSPVFASPSGSGQAAQFPFPARQSPIPSPFHSSPLGRVAVSVPSSPQREQREHRLSAPSAFALGLSTLPENRNSLTAPGNRAVGTVKKTWQPMRKSRKPGNLSLDLTQVDPPATDGKPTVRRSEQAAVCSHVTEFLYIGGAAAAKDRDNLLQVGITHIINCAANIAPAFYPEDFQYYNIRLRDHSTQDIARYFYNVFDFIEKARRRGGKVFVHCVKGISRSPTMAIAYLMWFKQIGMYKALDMVRQARPAVDPNVGFVFQLTEWEHSRLDGKLKLQLPVVFRIDVSGGNSGTGNSARAVEKPLIVGPLTSISEVVLARPTQEVAASCYVMASSDNLYLWRGSAASDVLVEAAQHAIALLQTYEAVPPEYAVVASGQEPPAFWCMLEAQQPHSSG